MAGRDGEEPTSHDLLDLLKGRLDTPGGKTPGGTPHIQSLPHGSYGYREGLVVTLLLFFLLCLYSLSVTSPQCPSPPPAPGPPAYSLHVSLTPHPALSPRDNNRRTEEPRNEYVDGTETVVLSFGWGKQLLTSFLSGFLPRCVSRLLVHPSLVDPRRPAPRVLSPHSPSSRTESSLAFPLQPRPVPSITPSGSVTVTVKQSS